MLAFPIEKKNYIGPSSNSKHQEITGWGGKGFESLFPSPCYYLILLLLQVVVVVNDKTEGEGCCNGRKGGRGKGGFESIRR